MILLLVWEEQEQLLSCKSKASECWRVIVSNATLHNQDEIDKRYKNWRCSNYTRAGDVIPEIVKVVIDKRLSTTTPYVMPLICPRCNSLCDKKQDEAY